MAHETPESEQQPVPAESAADSAATAAPEAPTPEGESAGSPETLAGEALQSADQAVETSSADTHAAQALQLDDLDPQPDRTEKDPSGLDLLRDVNLQVKVELGRTQMYVEDVLRLNEDSVIELDKLAGDPVDVYVNDRHVARGEILVVNESFCLRVSEIIRPLGPED